MTELKREPDLVDAQTGVGHANEPHRARRVAQSFGVDAARYDRTRPSYPEALVARVMAASPGPRVVDVGCGTGIVARLLRAAGCQVLGEVDARMAEFARRDGLEVERASDTRLSKSRIPCQLIAAPVERSQAALTPAPDLLQAPSRETSTGWPVCLEECPQVRLAVAVGEGMG